MAKSKLKLVKSKSRRLDPKAEGTSPGVPPAEVRPEESTRFEALMAARIARQVMLRRIMAEFEDLDGVSPAA